MIKERMIIPFTLRDRTYSLDVDESLFNEIQACLILGGSRLGATVLISVNEVKPEPVPTQASMKGQK